MAKTQYQVLYRYVNPNANQFITNDDKEKYNKVFEFYHEQHKIVCGTDDEILSANNEKSKLIIEGNSTANSNYGMLFKFTGTKRINKKVWKPKSIGYIVKDKNAIRHLVTRAVDGDYTGDFLLIEGDSIDNGVVVYKKTPTVITVCNDSTDAANGKFYLLEELMQKIKDSTFYSLKTNNPLDFTNDPNVNYLNQNMNGTPNTPVYTGPVFINEEPLPRGGNRASFPLCVLNKDNSTNKVTITPTKNIETYEIPAHYEEVADYPYVVCDTYEQIEQSPWFILSTHSSLTSAIEKAKSVVKAIGIDNVKVIKIVPTEQFVKIN